MILLTIMLLARVASMGSEISCDQLSVLITVQHNDMTHDTSTIIIMFYNQAVVYSILLALGVPTLSCPMSLR